MPDSPPILIVTALREEAATLLERLSVPQQRQRAPVRMAGKLSGQPVEILVTGDGHPRMKAALSGLPPDVTYRGMVLVGVAGALSPDLSVGSLIVAHRVEGHLQESTAFPDPAWHAAARELAGARDADLVTVPALLLDPDARAEARPGSGTSTAACDLESTAAVAAANRRGWPWIVLRVISDAADESLPRFLAGCSAEHGGLDRRLIALGALLRPHTIPALRRLSRRTREAAERLADTLERLLPSLAQATQTRAPSGDPESREP